MDILELTTPAQIRAVLTVSPSDLPDDIILDYGLADDLAEDLSGWLPGWESLSGDSELRTLRLYSKYYCAAQLAVTAQVFVLTKSTDGENEGQRRPVDFERMEAAFKAKAAKYRAVLLEASGAPTAQPREIVSVSSPARDVITEARSVS